MLPYFELGEKKNSVVKKNNNHYVSVTLVVCEATMSDNNFTDEQKLSKRMHVVYIQL